MDIEVLPTLAADVRQRQVASAGGMMEGRRGGS